MATNTNEREEIKPVAPTEQTKWRDPSLVGKYMVDPKTGLAGLFRSPDNGETWVLTDTVYGHVYNQDEVDNIWDNGAGHKVADEIKSATADLPNVRKQADKAVKFAESAIAASKVNSDAIVAQSEAISEAKTAMDSATAEIQQTAANAASDAAKIRADVARVQSEVDTTKAANSASVEALKSDVSAAKQDLADVHDSLTKAQSAIEQNQKLINDSVTKITSDVSATKQDLANVHDSLTKAQAAAEENQKAIDKSIAQINTNVDATNQDLAGIRKDLTKAQADITANQKSINDNVAQINADITQDRKDIASAQQANEDTAKQLDDYSKQAAAQGKTIKSIQDKQDGFTATLADVQGNVAQVSDKVDGLSASLKDTQGNVASVKAQADQLSATLTDHGKAIATLAASAKELSSTLEDADGRLSKVEQTAQTNSSTLSDVQGDLSQVKQDATTLTATLKDAQGNISMLQQKADSVSAQLATAQGDIATLQTGIAGVKATLASHDKSIHTLQLDSKSLKDSMADAQGDISTLSKTATSLDSEMKDHAGRLSKVEQSATTQATTLSDLQGNLTQVKQQADGLVTTLKDAQGNITQIQQKADGTLEQLKSAQGDIASLQTDVTGIKATLTSHEGDIHTLQADSKILKDDMADAQGNISSLQKSSTKLDSEMSSQDGRLSKVEQTAKEHTSTISDLGDKLNNMKIGGRNLLTNTDKDISVTSHTTDSWPAWANVDTGYSFEHGKTYTFSTEARNSTDKITEASIRVFEFSTNTQVGIYAFPADGKRHSVTFAIPNDSHDYHLLLYAGHAGIIPGVDVTTTYHHPKLEEGNVATDWTPAPEDLATTTQVKQTADGIETTLKSAQGDIDQIKQTAKGTSEQLSNVQGDVTNIQKDVNGLKQTTADNAGNIHTLQSDSKSLHDSMQDAQGDISTLKKTSTDVVSELKNHAGRISKTEQTASMLVNEFADQQGHLNRVEQTAQGTQQTVANQQGQINNIKTDAAGIHETLTGQGNQIANINVTLSGLNSKYEGVSGDLGKLKNSAMQNRGTVSAPDFNSLTAAGFYTITVPSRGKNYPTDSWGTLEVSGQTSDSNGRLNQKYVSDNNAETYARQYNANTKSWTAWIKAANQNDVTALSNRITTNSTQITQNKQAIALKADQSTVNNLSGEVSQTQAQLKVQAGQISSKVSSTDFKTLDDKVNGMKIGGRNLLHNTSDQFKALSGSGWLSKSTTSDIYTSTSKYHSGDQFTYSALVTNNSNHPVKLEVWLFYGQDKGTKPSQVNFHSNEAPAHSSNVRLSVTFPIDMETCWIRTYVVYSDGKGTASENIQVAEEQLESGNTRTQWSPNPDDFVASIKKNSTAIDQTNKQISLKADQTEVNQVKQTATQNSSRLNVMANEISSKATSTDVNNIVDSKGYATTSTVQSLITQKAGSINEQITNLTTEFNARDGINLLTGTKDFNGAWQTYDNDDHWHKENWVDPNGNYSLKSDSMVWNGYYQSKWLDVGTYTFSLFYYLEANYPTNEGLYIYCIPNGGDNLISASPGYSQSLDITPNKWNYAHFTFEVTKAGYSALRIESTQSAVLHISSYKLQRGSIATPWTPAPSDNATVTQVQSLTASIDGLQSRVTNYQNDTSSKYTQLSNLMQSKVGTADFDNLKRSVDMQTLDSADINNMKTNGHYFVRNLANNPIVGWVYVDVTGNGNDRIRQDVYQDYGIKHKYRRWFGTYWTGWEEGATYTEITQLQDAVNLRVQKGELLSQINLTAGNTLIQSNKLYLDASSVVFSGRAFIPSAAIASLSADKINTGTLNTDNISLSNGHVRLSSDDDHFYIQTEENAVNNPTTRFNFDGIDFLTDAIPNGYNSSVPYYSIGYDGASNGYLRISAFDHINPGGTTATQNWYTMVDAISLTNSEINFATKGNMHMQVVNGGVNIKPSLFFQNNTNNGTYAGFTRLDNSNTVEFNTGDNNGENFHVNSGARFMKYVYFNDYCRAQGWLTYSTLSKKTNIKKLDTSLALDKIRQDDQYLYEYKRNVAKGVYDPQASFIIDDVNDVSHYSVPREFIDQTGKYREPSVELSYLIAAFQEIDKQVQTQKEEIKELKEKLQHE